MSKRPKPTRPKTKNPRTESARSESAPAEPIRTCVGCRRPAGRSSLVRLVAVDGRLSLGEGRPGRGAWLCVGSVIECFDEATASRAWSRSFRQRIEADSTVEVRNELVAIQQSTNAN